MIYGSRIPIIILHGWAKHLSGKNYHELKMLLGKKGFKVYAPDLPGFGNEPLLKNSMNLNDYVEFVKSYMGKNSIKKATIIGHSFGGRIGAKLAASCPDMVDKLILTGAPLIKDTLSTKKKIVKSIAFVGSKIFILFPHNLKNVFRKLLYASIGEWDYYKAGDLKETFKNIVAEDLFLVLSKIKVKTLIVWGEVDTFVPLRIGESIARRIPGSKFVIVPKTTHKLPYENPSAFYQAIQSFL